MHSSKEILYLQELFTQKNSAQITRILSSLYTVLLFSYVLLISTRILVKDYNEIIYLSIGIILILFSLRFFRKTRLRAAVLSLTLFLMLQITIIAVFGQGVRDLAVLGFPALLFIASLLLTKNDYFITVLFSLFCILVITIGPVIGIYTPKPPPAPSVIDFIIVSVITSMAGIISYLITAAMKKNLDKSNKEAYERKLVSEKLEKSLQEKEVLFKEVHHRVKNNLSVISSLLNLQKQYIQSKEDAVDSFDDMRNRIFSIAQVHEQLYQSSTLSSIDMESYISSLTNMLKTMHVFGTKITYSLNISNIFLSIDDAVPCGIIINELVTNSIKHAFTNRDNGAVSITLEEDSDGLCTLYYSDNGRGLQKPVDLENPESLGLKLIHVLTKQLDGTISIESSNGISFNIIFPKSNPRLPEPE